MIIRDYDQVTKVEDVITVIRAVSFALIVVPFMSLIRGFFKDINQWDLQPFHK